MDTPIVQTEEYTLFPHNPYGWNDFFVGMALGIYGPLNMRQRNYDCFSRMQSFGISIADFHKYFDREFNVKNAL